MSAMCAALVAAALPAAVAGAPVERALAGGVVNWTDLTVHVNGVGTPRILSPTGSVTPRPPYESAREDARRRLGRVLAALPIDAARRVRDVPALQARREVALKGFTTGEAKHFSDGTVHLPARLPFGWLASALPTASPGAMSAPGSPPGGASGIIVIASGDPRPALQVRLSDPAGERAVTGGLLGDPVGAGGVVWVSDRAQAEAHRLAGPRPLILKARGGGAPGRLVLDAPSATMLLGGDGSAAAPMIGGGVVVIVGE